MAVMGLAAATRFVTDMCVVRLGQTRRLFTHEDGRFFHAHKLLGTTVLLHFCYRFFLWTMRGSMGFDDKTVADNKWTFLTLYAAHVLLHVSSFEFVVPVRRNLRYNVIWTEMRWHALIFAYRSLAVLLLHWVHVVVSAPLLSRLSPEARASTWARALAELSGGGPWSVVTRGTIVLLTMASADAVTVSYRRRTRSLQPTQDASSPPPPEATYDTTSASTSTSTSTSMTMRSNPYPHYLPAACTRVHNLFYSVSQVLGTLNIVTCTNLDRVFAILLAVQTAPFCMTLVKKGVLTQAGWHLYYTLALLANYALVLTPWVERWSQSRRAEADQTEDTGALDSCTFCGNIPSMLYLALAFTFSVARFRMRVDKYFLWSVVTLVVATARA